MATDMAALLLLYFSLAVVQAGPRVCGVRGYARGPPLTLPSSSFYDSTFSRSSTRTWQALSLPAQAGADGSPALHARPSRASPESWSSRARPAHRWRKRRSAPLWHSRKYKWKGVEVKDHLRAGDFERASCYTQSRQDSSP